MAPRYKLKLTKLDFLSLVDQPAQETATIRLIKRAGVDDQVEGTMRIVKVDSGDNPLVHCWAFTCTDESGQPYHDLQGDAVTADYIKAAEAWFAAGAAVDEMHDRNQTARVAFAYPIDSDIVTAMLGNEAGAATKISGLMAAIRPTPDQLEKIRAHKYNGVSIAGTGIRELVKAKPKKKPQKTGAAAAPDDTTPYQRVGKVAALTSEVLGHRHSIDLGDPADEWWSDRLSTSSQTAEGAEQPHSHAWTYDPATGTITIGEDSGHTHTVDAVVPADVLAAAAEEDDDKRCPGCGAMCDADDRYCCSCGRSLCGEPAPACAAPPPAPAPAQAVPAVVVVAARAEDNTPAPSNAEKAVPAPSNAEKAASAPSGAETNTPAPLGAEKTAPAPSGNDSTPASGAGISTPASVPPSVPNMTQENSPMDPKFVKMLNVALALPDAQRLHVAKLAPVEQEAFLELDAAERDAAMKAADLADPEVYKAADGTSIRKSHGALAERLARQADAQAAELAKQAQELEIEKAERARIQFEKRATDLIPLVGKSLIERVAIIKAIDGIADEALRTGVIEALKGANAAFTMLGKSVGVGGDDGPRADDPHGKLNELAQKYATDHKVPFAKAYDAVLQTREGIALYQKIETPVARA